MNAESIELTVSLPARPEEIYTAWLSSRGHTEMTGGPAQTSADPGAAFTAWGPYIRGRNLALDEGRRIVQAWRTLDFPADAPDSQVEVELVPEGEGTRLRLRHSNIPAGQGARYEGGWQERYFTPMARYFAARRSAT